MTGAVPTRIGQDLDDHHPTATAWARRRLRRFGSAVVIVLSIARDRGRHGQQLADQRQLGAAMPVGEEAPGSRRRADLAGAGCVADALEPVGQNMQQEAAHELVGVEDHALGSRRVAIIAPCKGDTGVVDRDEPVVGDGDAVGVAGKVGQHLLGAGKRALGVDQPFDAARRSQRRIEGGRLGERCQIAGEAQLAGAVDRDQLR